MSERHRETGSKPSLLFYNYIPDDKIGALSHYKYRGEDRSLLAKLFLSRYWNYCMNFVPLWIAPNLITLLGFFTVVFSFFLTWSYSPNFTGELPFFINILVGLCLFFYQTMDNLDGKQARRTATSSPLGQLFDHGCDALNISLSVMNFAACAQTGLTFDTFLYFLVNHVIFFLATWEEYHTGLLYLGYINGPDEGIFLVCFLHIFTAFVGNSFWLLNFKEATGITLPFLSETIKMNQALLYLTIIGCIITYITNFYNIALVIKISDTPKAIKRLGAHIILESLALIWYFTSPTNIFYKEAYICYSIWSMLAAILVGELIVCHVTHREFNVFQIYIIPLLVAVINANWSNFIGSSTKFPLFDEVRMVRVLLAITVFFYFHWSLNIIRQICDFLNIRCLRIPYRKKE